MRETPAKYEFTILVEGVAQSVAPTKISVQWGRPREIQRPCRAPGDSYSCTASRTRYAVEVV